MKIVNKNWKSFLINILKSMPNFKISWTNNLSSDFSWNNNEYMGFSTNVPGVILVNHKNIIFRFNLNKNKDKKRFLKFVKEK